MTAALAILNVGDVKAAGPSLPNLKTGAILSDCGTYRYSLWREWDAARLRVLFVMLNPSTADASQDDPTIRRCIGFAKSWGYGGVEVVNLFALRATDPRELAQHRDPVGPANFVAIHDAASSAGTVVCAWGAHAFAAKRAAEVLAESRKLRGGSVDCLRTTKDGHPAHPLYLPAALKPFPYRETWP
jgi:hypothetical protein